MKRRSILVNGIIMAAAGFVCLVLYKYLHPNNRNALTDQILDSVGLTLILFGQYIRISARGYKSEALLKNDAIITDGPYAFVRHPMYLASFLIGMGAAVMLFKWWMVAVYLAFFLLWYGPQIRTEQQWLLKKYGQQYIDYCKKTPCFFPRMKTLISFRAKKYIPLRLAWLKREWNTILVWSIVIVVVEGYQDIHLYTLSGFLRELIFLLLIVFYFAAFAFMFREG